LSVTHEYIRTGHLDSKFGFDPQALDVFSFVVSTSLSCVGLHAHILSDFLNANRIRILLV